MAHEIQKHDKVVLHRKQAWHGLGLVVEEAPTPLEALELADLDWIVEQRPVYTKGPDNEEIRVPGHVANFREDIDEFFAITTSGYKPIQNQRVASFCEALVGEDESVRCESVGSVRNGRRVWFLLKGEPFDVAHGDTIYPYVLVSNGHDGTTSFRVTPTTVRVVCSNTLHAVVPNYDKGAIGKSAIVIRHTENVMQRVREARAALQRYSKSIEETRELANVLSSKDVKQEDVQQFFLECYTADFGEVPANPQDRKEERRRAKAMSAYNHFAKRFDDDRKIAGASLWNAFNAYSGLVQHDLKARGKNDADRIEKRVDSNLFGLNQQRTISALEIAFKHAVA